MEFAAYPSVPQGGHKSRALCQVQGILRGNDSVLLPCALLLAAVCAVLYEHATADTHFDNDNSIRNFLALIVVTMLPLAFLEKKILACADPVSLISKFSSHVLLLHACFLGARVRTVYLSAGPFTSDMCVPFGGLVAACTLLPTYFGFRLSRATLHEHQEALVVACFALAAALVTEGVVEYRHPTNYHWVDGVHRVGAVSFLRKAGDTGALYVELLAFVPAVWMVCKAGSAAYTSAQPADVGDTRRRAIAFFAFLLGFYFTEDVLSAVRLARDLPLAAMGHATHFLLLLDFAGFLLANLYDPDKLDKLMGSLKHLFAEACLV